MRQLISAVTFLLFILVTAWIEHYNYIFPYLLTIISILFGLAIELPGWLDHVEACRFDLKYCLITGMPAAVLLSLPYWANSMVTVNPSITIVIHVLQQQAVIAMTGTWLGIVLLRSFRPKGRDFSQYNDDTSSEPLKQNGWAVVVKKHNRKGIKL